MPTINHSKSMVGAGKAMKVSWSTVTTGDVGQAFEIPMSSEKSIQCEGTFAGATCTMQGSNDGSNWQTLTDLAGNALTFAAAGLKGVRETVRYIRPSVAAGAGSLNITMIAKIS